MAQLNPEQQAKVDAARKAIDAENFENHRDRGFRGQFT